MSIVANAMRPSQDFKQMRESICLGLDQNTSRHGNSWITMRTRSALTSDIPKAFIYLLGKL